MSIFKACDIRGVVGEEWDVPEAVAIGRALGRMLRRHGQSTVVVGGDFRRSTPRLKKALCQGLQSAGIGVVDIGQVATPVVHFAARHAGCSNWAVVTASHNPGKYNGIKFLVDGKPAIPSVIKELEQSIELEGGDESGGNLTTCDVLEAYVPWVVGFSKDLASIPCHATDAVNHNSPRQQPLRVAVDPMGGAFTGLAHDALASAGYDVVELDEHLDHNFERRDPDPSKDTNLDPLVQTVPQLGADAGLALDGDGDRVIFVDELGTIVRPEQIASLLVQHVFGRCTLVHDLKCASMLRRVVEEHGGTVIMQPSGHGFIKTAMLKEQAELGVEVSGHHFFGVLNGGDDGLFTGLLVLALMQTNGRSLSELLAPFDWPPITPDLRIPFAGDVQAVLDTIASSCGGQVSRMDGVRTEYDDLGWALARGSVTEPAITCRFEGRDHDCLRAIVERFLAQTPELRKLVLERIS